MRVRMKDEKYFGPEAEKKQETFLCAFIDLNSQRE
jgi:hypothetical protein